MNTLAALVVDDETLAREKLKSLLAEHDWIRVAGECSDGGEAVSAIDNVKPDVVFLDIRMPVLSGLEVLERITHRPRVIFTTAFDKYAATAFELQALDYLVKPFSGKRLSAALERIKAEAAAPPDTDTVKRMRSALGGEYMNRLFVRTAGKIVPVRTSDVTRLEARDDYVAIYAAGRRHLVQITMNALEKRLDPATFVRVHRSHMVNMDHVTSLERYDGARLQISLDDGSTVVASRSRSQQLREKVL